MAISQSRGSCVLLLVATLHAQEMSVAEPTVVLTGRVVDQRGEPVPAAEVRCTGARAPETPLKQALADGDGAFRLVVARHDWHRLEVRRKGYAPRRAQVEDARWTEVALQEATTVTVAVVDAAGHPVPDCEVLAQPADGLGDAWTRGKTDAAGVATLHDCALAPVRFLGWIPGSGLAVRTLAVRGPGEVRIDPTGLKAATVRIRVAAKDGATLDGVEPVLVALGHGGDLPMPNGLCWQRDEPGRYSVGDLAPLHYQVRVHAPGRAVWPRHQEFEQLQGEVELGFHVTPRTTSSFTAAVRDRNGEPVAGVRIVVQDEDRVQRGEGISDAAGTVQFPTDLYPGENLRIRSRSSDWVAFKVQGPWQGIDVAGELQPWLHDRYDPGTAIELRVRPAGAIRGRVVAASGAPAPRARVSLEVGQPAGRPSYYVAQAVTIANVDGTFAFAGLDPRCSLRVHARLDRDTGASRPIAAPEPGEPDGGEVVVRLAPASTVAGVVRDDAQKPVPGVRVHLFDVSGGAGQPQRPLGSVYTDHLGRYRFLAVDASEVVLNITAGEPNREEASEVFTVKPGVNERDLSYRRT